MKYRERFLQILTSVLGKGEHSLKMRIIPQFIYILRGIPVFISGKYFQKLNSLFIANLVRLTVLGYKCIKILWNQLHQLKIYLLMSNKEIQTFGSGVPALSHSIHWSSHI